MYPAQAVERPILPTDDLVELLRSRIDREPATLDRILERLRTRSSGVVRTTLADRERAGELEGYLRGYRPGSSPANTSIDVEVCAESDCAHCGHHGQRCVPFHDRGGTYLAFAVCPRCDHSEPF